MPFEHLLISWWQPLLVTLQRMTSEGSTATRTLVREVAWFKAGERNRPLVYLISVAATPVLLVLWILGAFGLPSPVYALLVLLCLVYPWSLVKRACGDQRRLTLSWFACKAQVFLHLGAAVPAAYRLVRTRA
jgi:hypothetical protein